MTLTVATLPLPDSLIAFARACVHDPMLFVSTIWPDAQPYDKEVEIMRSVERNDETFVPAAQKTGKDWTSARTCLWFFCTRTPCRIVTTSAKAEHLMVLWGEMRDAIDHCAITKLTPHGSLDVRRGGPLHIMHQEIHQMQGGRRVPLSYLKGMVASQDTIAAMGGHHIADWGDHVPRTLLVIDEASSVDTRMYTTALPWANRVLVIGNTWPCENFWKHAIEGDVVTGDSGGDRIDPDTLLFPRGQQRYWRRVIPITAEDHPNVKLGMAEVAAGKKPSHKVVVPGKTYAEYVKDLATLPPDDLSVKVYAQFYKGAEVKLYPEQRIKLGNALWLLLKERMPNRKAKGIGVDPGEGSANTSLVAADEYGIIEVLSKKTPDTAEIEEMIIAFAEKHDVTWENVLIDLGAGLQIADYMRKKGMNVRTIAFGAGVEMEYRSGMKTVKQKVEHREEHHRYLNRRAQMYYELGDLMDPSADPEDRWHGLPHAFEVSGFAIPPGSEGPASAELIRQMLKIPRCKDDEGRLFMLPKQRSTTDAGKANKVTLMDLIGHSPDELDAACLSVHAVLHPRKPMKAGAVR